MNGPNRFVRAFTISQIPIGLALASVRSIHDGYSTYFLYYQGLYSIVAASLIVSTIAARSRGAFWFGFAVVGWGYFLLANLGRGENLITSRALDDLAVWFYFGRPTEGSLSSHEVVATTRIGHMLLTLLLGYVGGVVTAYFEPRTRESDEADPTPTPAPAPPTFAAPPWDAPGN
ncbi:hypothetical protein [Singulisphaera sp. PoT]|uniref:hypothetical protein n=1 Tax=Singulisphaera sp. PoT TaxID=3411797 RepID=UPI003BF4783C